MPIYHSSATLMGLAHCLEAACTFAIGKRFSTRTFWREARAHRASMIQYVGETCRYLLAAPAERDPVTGESMDRRHGVRLAFGNGLRPDVWERFRDRFGIEAIAEFYGATEGPLATFNLTHNEWASGAVGRNGWLYGLLSMRRRVAIAAVDSDTDAEQQQLARDPRTGLCRRAARGEPGELLFALDPGDEKRDFQGYYGNAEATGGKIARDVFRKGDVYFRSGDLVTWDPTDGRMYFHDRLGDTFRWKSENVATTEVAQVLLGAHAGGSGAGTDDQTQGQDHHLLVREANVYGVRMPHHDGRAGAAAVVLFPRPGSSEVDAETLRALAQYALQHLPKYAVPLFLRVSDDLGHAVTGTNKQQKHRLRDQGVDPAQVGGDRVFWLRDGTYVPFTGGDWEMLNAGKVKL